MTKADSLKTLEIIKEIESLDVAGLLRETYQEGEFSAISIGELSASNLITVIKRVVAIFKDAMEADGMLLPRYVQVGSGRMDLMKDLGHLLEYSKTKRWREAETTLTGFLIPYVMQAGYWARVAEQTGVEHQLKATQLLVNTEEQIATIRASIATLKQEEVGLREQLKKSRAELDQVTSAAGAATADASRIRQSVAAAQGDQAALSSMKQTWDTQTKIATTTKEALDKKTKDWDVEKAAILVAINESQAATTRLLKESKVSHEWIERKRIDIIKLTGLAADGSLGHSFNQRKAALVEALGYWKTASIWASILVVVYVFVVYLTIPVPDNPILAVITGIGKVLPVLLAYGFVLRQYSRERSFLEEYEFKAAVALVVNAYADQLAPPKLNEADFKDAKALQEYLRAKEDERRKLISDTVAKLFTPPHIHTEKSANVFTAFRPKAATDMIREAKELIKEAKA